MRRARQCDLGGREGSPEKGGEAGQQLGSIASSAAVSLLIWVDTEHTGASPAAFGLKLPSRLLKRFMRLTGRLTSAVMTTSRQLRRTKAMQGSTNHSNSENICRKITEKFAWRSNYTSAERQMQFYS